MSNNENSVLEYLKANNEVLFDKIVNALRKGKQVNFTDINQSDIIILSPQKAFEMREKKAISILKFGW